jgi:hypothetical protein
MNRYTRAAILILFTLGLMNCSKVPEDTVGSKITDLNDLYKFESDAPHCSTINKNSLSEEVVCNCSEDDYNSASSDKVVGTAIYHISSEICFAAKHSNLTQKNKPSTVIIKPGQQCSYFSGTMLNGLSSLTRVLSGNEPTFYFKGFSDGQCPELPNKSLCPSQTLTWTNNGDTCTAVVAEYNNINGGTGNANDSDGSAGSPTGSATFTCSGNSWSSLPLAGTTCSKVDTNPEAMIFPTKNGVELKRLQISDAILPMNFNTASVVNVSSGSYRIKQDSTWSNWTSTPGTITPGNLIQISHISSNLNDTSVSSQITIGTTIAQFTSLTRALDLTPTSFHFDAQIDTGTFTRVESNFVTISGLDGPTAVSITGGSFSIYDGHNWSAWQTSGTIRSTYSIKVSHRTSQMYLTQVSSTLTIGTVSKTFISTTRNGFDYASIGTGTYNFTEKTKVSIGALITSQQMQVTQLGINPVSISVSGSHNEEFRIYHKNVQNLWVWSEWSSTTSLTIANRNIVQARHRASAANNTTVTSILQIGTVTLNFKSTTKAP